MTTDEWIVALDAMIGVPLDRLLDQMREDLRVLVPADKFEEWDKETRAIQKNAEKYRSKT